MSIQKNILLKISGSIAAFKAASLASLLIKKGYAVKVVLTKNARDFIGDGTFEGITGNKVQSNLFFEGERMDHIHLARWADLQIIYPASAETLSKLSHGRADDLLSCLFLSKEKNKPYLIAPAMNPEMYTHPAVTENIEKIKKYGATILEPESGRTACGEEGVGRVVEPDVVLEEIEKIFSKSLTKKTLPLSGKKILITAGGTFEPIDSVRGLTNISTGETGSKIANALSESGADVTLLLANSAVKFSFLSPLKLVRFSTFEELEEKLFNEVENNSFEICIHSAAVSDFKIDKIETTSGVRVEVGGKKISSNEDLVLTLKKRHKIISMIKSKSKNKKMKLISFKLSSSHDPALTEISGYTFSDLVIHNYSYEIDRKTDAHKAQFFKSDGVSFKLSKKTETKSQMINVIKEVIENDFSN